MNEVTYFTIRYMLNVVWDGLDETKSHTGEIVFLEDDHLVTKDFYVSLKRVRQIRDAICPHCFNTNLARYIYCNVL